MIAAAENPNNAGLLHRLEQHVNNLLDPPQLRLVTMCLATRMAGEFIYEKSLLWSANQQSCMKYAPPPKKIGMDSTWGACYMVEFLVHPEVSIPLTIGVLLFAFAGRQVFNILYDIAEFRPQNITLLSAGLMLYAIGEVLGYQTGY